MVELEPPLCWLLWTGILDGSTPLAPDAGAEADVEVI